MKRIRVKITLLVCLCFVTFMAYGHSIHSFQRTKVDPFQLNLIQTLQKQIPTLLRNYQTPGVAIALVDKQGVIWSQGFGVTDKKNPKNITPDTLFSVQSQSKVFTALGVVRAVQLGLVSLNEPIYHYLPNLQIYSAFEKNPINKITLKNLLSHTSGLAHEAPIGNNYNAQPDFLTHIKSILKGTWLEFPVGQGYQYSNPGFDLAGYILQVRSHQSFEKFIQKQVFNPLQMYKSTLSLNEFLSNSDRAVGHIDGLDIAPLNYSVIPAGGMYSTALDLAHYIQFQLNNGIFNQHRVLKIELLQTLLSIPFPLPGQTEGYALGIWKGKRFNTYYYCHLGRGFGFGCDLEWYPEYGIGVIVLTNKGDSNNTDIAIAHSIIDPLLKNKQEIQNKDLWKKIAGEYISDSGSTIRITTDKKLKGIFLQGELNEGPMENNIRRVNIYLNYLGNLIFYTADSNQYYRYVPATQTNTAMIERISDGNRWYLNVSNSMPVGPNKAEWRKYVGTYKLRGYGSDSQITVCLKKGYLYLNNFKLREIQHNVFSAANGQILLFARGPHATWGNIPISRENEIEMKSKVLVK